MIFRPHFRFVSVLLTITALRAAEFPDAVQPQLAATAEGHVWVAFGRGKEVLVAASRDAGANFDAPVRVASLPSLMVGRRRGPRIVAHGDNVTLTVMAGEFFAFTSKDGGKTWAGPALINDVRRSAREGLDGLAVAPDGRLYAVWLDDRTGPKQLYGAESTDGGVTWSKNEEIYRSPDKTICECCHPSAIFNDRGDLAVMWRNSIGGNRDMWFAVRTASTKAFGTPAKFGEGTWPLKACPMDGGALIVETNSLASVWQRDGSVYYARAGEPEKKLSAGVQPAAASTGTQSMAVWQQGKDLWAETFRSGTQSKPKLIASDARFPSLVGVPGVNRVLVAYERGTGIAVNFVGDAVR